MFRGGRPVALRRRDELSHRCCRGPLPARAAGRRGRDRGRGDHGAVPGRGCGGARVVVSFAPLWLGRAGPAPHRPAGRDACATRCPCCLRWRCWRCVLLARGRSAPGGRRCAGPQRGRARSIGSASMSARDGPGTRLDAARARADGDRGRPGRRRPGPRRVVRRRRHRGERLRGRHRPACGARSPPSRPARSRATCRARSPSRRRSCAAARGPTVVLVSDGGFSEEARRAVPATSMSASRPSGLDVGPRGGNVGIISFAARRVPADPGHGGGGAGRPELRRRAAASVALDIAAGDATVERVRAGRSGPASAGATKLPNVFAADARLQARLLTADGDGRSRRATRRDDPRARRRRPSRSCPPFPAAACCAWAARDLYLDGALLSLGRTVTVERVTPAAAEAQRARWPDYDLVIFDGVTPAPPPTTGRFLYLDAHGAGSPFAERGTVRDPVIADVRRDHPLRPPAGSHRRQHRRGAPPGAGARRRRGGGIVRRAAADRPRASRPADRRHQLRPARLRPADAARVSAADRQRARLGAGT